MRFRRGCKVEVMNKREVPISWCAGEILSGNGRNYTVKFESETITENVSKKLIRPCPPHVKGVENIVSGDIVEVLLEFSWKIASILKVLPKDLYLIRLLGSSQEFCIHRSNIRVRQSWEDDKWILMRKGSGGHGFVKSGCLATKMPQDRVIVQSNTGLQVSRKRISPYCSSIIESPQKRRAIENNNTHGYLELERKGQDCNLARSSESNGYDSNAEASSVGSCSVTSRRSLNNELEDSFCSDAESSSYCLVGTLEEEFEAIIPRLELHAYRCTLEALYASGPLSWDQEALLTNLRITLHISNDEHLIELRNLISSKSNRQ